LQIVTLSNRADLVSGGDAFVEIILPDHGPLQRLQVRVGDRDVSSAFARRADGRITGVITGLAVGPNVVTADAAGANAASLTITNHPIGGPVFSGPQPLPFVCATPVAMPAVGNTPASNASGLAPSPPMPSATSRPSSSSTIERPRRAARAVLPDPNPPTARRPTAASSAFDPAPAAAGRSRDDHHRCGVTMPYIVRVERGTLNRGIYDIAVLFDPTRDDPATGWKPYAPQPGWNRKARVLVRRQQQPAAPAVPLRADLDRR
jgi:hypothetical protein